MTSTFRDIILVKRRNFKRFIVVSLKLDRFQGKMVPFQRSMLKGTLWNEANMTYNFFCQHTRWNQVKHAIPYTT